MKMPGPPPPLPAALPAVPAQEKAARRALSPAQQAANPQNLFYTTPAKCFHLETSTPYSSLSRFTSAL